MSALIGNPMLLTSAPSGDDAYQIEKSLRLDSADGANLSKIESDGNQRIWTWSGWVKRNKIGRERLFLSTTGATHPSTQIIFEQSSELSIYSYTGSAYNFNLISTAIFQDFSAWYHFVVAVDTTQAIETERVKLFVNGVQHTSFGTASWPTQYFATEINTSGKKIQLSDVTSFNHPLNCYLADVHFIDGLALSPAAFGSSDSLGGWNPKAFALPTPNDGTTWSNGTFTLPDSSNASVTWHNNAPVTRLFDGEVSSSTNAYPSTTVRWEWTIPDIPCNSTFRMSKNSAGSPGISTLTTDAGTVDVTITSPGSQAWVNFPLPSGTTKLTKLLVPGSTNNWIDVGGFEVDGVLLKDGQTDSAVRYTSPNNGTTWSDGWSGDFFGNWTGVKSFDGKYLGVFVSDEATRPDTGDTVTWTAPHSISFTKLELQGMTDGGTIKVNNTDVGTAVNGAWPLWHDITSSISSPLTEIKLTSVGTGRPVLTGVRVDGHVLIDSHNDNSFHLKFNDISTSSSLGLSNSLAGANNTALGGAILNVKTGADDEYALNTGTNGDKNKSHLELAIAGNTIADISHTVIGSGSAVSLTNNNVTASTDQSKFYGTSMYFDGDGDYIDTAAIDTDNKFCMEYWMRPDVLQNCRPFNGSDNLNGSAYLYTELLSTGAIKCRQASIGIIESAAGKISANTWHHVAYTYDGTTQRLFIDGALEASATGSWSPPADMKFRLGADEGSASSGEYKGYIQDARLYFGTQKYTESFRSANNGFTVNNITYAVEAGDTGPWTTEFKTDGSSWSGANSLTISSGSTHSTNANNNLFHCDTSLLGDYDLTITDTGGESGIHFYSSTDGSSYSEVSNSYNAASLSLTNVGTPSHTYNRYIRIGGTGSGNVTITITGRLNLSGSGTAANASDVDSFVDSPTAYGDEDTGIGGEVRGNYATMNSLSWADHGYGGWTLSQGNLHVKAASGSDSRIAATIGASSGKWYWEVEELAPGTSSGIGINKEPNDYHATWNGTGDYVMYQSSGNKHINGSGTSYGNSYTKGDVIGVQWDADNGAIYFWKNGTIENSGTAARTGMSGLYTPILVCTSSGTAAEFTINFGQRAFKYTNAGTNRPSADYKCLCTQNLPDTFSGDELNNPSKYFDVKLITGTNVNDRQIKGWPFGPDLVWCKTRNNAASHKLYDKIRGVNHALYTDLSNAPNTNSNQLSAWRDDGYDIGTGENTQYYDGGTGVHWGWDLGTAASGANTNGSINIDSGNQWVNNTAGISMTKYEGTGANATVGHGLSTAPEMIIIKGLGDLHWPVYTKDRGATHYWLFDVYNSATDSDTYWQDTAPNDTVFSIGTSVYLNQDGTDFMAYCFTSIPGYSAVGSYTGSGVDQNFVYLGFSPKYLLIKGDIQGENWICWDTARTPNNQTRTILRTNANTAEATASEPFDKDLLSNGFCTRSTSTVTNTNGTKYYYLAFAEHPFKTARAQ